MGKFWLGEYPDRGDAIVAFEDGEVQSGTSMSVFSSTIAVYGDGEIFLGPAHGFSPDATYKDGEIYIGSAAGWTPDAVYENGRVWLGQHKHGPPAGCYEGDDDGGAAAAFVVLLHGVTEDEESSGDKIDDADSGFSYESGVDYHYVSSAISTPTVEPTSSDSEVGGFIGGLIALGIIVGFLLLIFQSPTEQVAPSRAIEKKQTPPTSIPTPTPRASELPSPQKLLRLEMNVDEKSPIDVNSNFELVLQDGTIISQPLRFDDGYRPVKVIPSISSPTGRFQFFTLCSSDWCDDSRLLDRKSRMLVEIFISKSGAAQGVVWSPDERFAFVVWKHAGLSGHKEVNLKTWEVRDGEPMFFDWMPKQPVERTPTQ